MHSKRFIRRVLPLTMTAIMVASCFPAMAATPVDDWTLDVEGKKATITIDDEELGLTYYTDYYLDKDGKLTEKQYENAQVNVYVPDGATVDSPIVYYVENSGWFMNSYHSFESGTDVVKEKMSTTINPTGGQEAFVADALQKNCVVVTAGVRSRKVMNYSYNPTTGKYSVSMERQKDADGNYLHSPVTVSDAKAVIRFLRYNDAIGTLPAGDTNKIIITGHSGGGALSSVIGASGNSEDYYEDLMEIGAAGITKTSDGTYTSSINDDVLAVVAYSPITDLGHADGAYEYTYGSTRDALLEMVDDNLDENGISGVDSVLVGNVLSDATIACSSSLAYNWTLYAQKLNLKDEAGNALTFGYNQTDIQAEGTFYEKMKDLIIAGMQKGLDATSTDEFAVTLDKKGEAVYEELGISAEEVKDKIGILVGTADQNPMVTIENGKVTDIDMDKYLLFVSANQALKNAPAFDNEGTTNAAVYQGAMYNENNLWGADSDNYGHVVKEGYDLEANGTDFWNKYNANMTWEQYWAANGESLTEQMRMADSIAYLTNTQGAEGDSAPYWYVRHGITDRDTSFANQTLLYYALINDQTIDQEYTNFAFGWCYGHIGWQDVSEASDWVDTVLADYTADNANTGDANTGSSGNSDGITPTVPSSPQTGVGSGMLPMVIASIAAVAGASVRGKKIH